MRACPRLLTACAAAASLTALVGARQPPPFVVDETTIAQVHAAMKAGTLTCRSLVEQYLRRIEAYDKKGPALNAIVIVNPKALTEADDLDRRFKPAGLIGPLHCVPTIVKDNFETIGLQSADGSLVARRDSSRIATRSRCADQRGGRHRDREVEHGGVRVHARTRRSARSCPATRRTRTRSIGSRPARAAARLRRSPRTSAPSASAAIPATRSAGRRRTRRWSGSGRRWG